MERIPLPSPEVFGSVAQPISPSPMGFSFRDEGAEYSPTSDEEMPVEPRVSSLSGGEPLGDGETLKTLPFLGEDEPPKDGKMDPSKYPKNGQKASVSRDFLGSDGKSPKKAPLGDGETLKTLVEIGKQKCLGEPLGEKGSQGSMLGQKCLGEPLGENGSQGSLLGEKCLGEPLGENGSQGPLLDQKSLQESLGEKREPREIVRMMRLEDLEDMWTKGHQGVSRELNRVLQLVPEDGDEGWTFGVVVGMFQGIRDVLEDGLTEVNQRKGKQLDRLCAVGTPETVDSPNEVLQTVTMSLSEVRKNLDDWVAPMRAEYLSLTKETGAVEPVDVKDLPQDKVEFVPGKLVCVVKAGPNGERKSVGGLFAVTLWNLILPQLVSTRRGLMGP